MRNRTTTSTALVVAALLLALSAGATADHGDGYGQWQPIPDRMVGVHCDTIDGGNPAVVTLGEHAMFSDVDGTRYVVTMPGRICSS